MTFPGHMQNQTQNQTWAATSLDYAYEEEEDEEPPTFAGWLPALAVLVWLRDVCLDIRRCCQEGCMEVARRTFTWPGRTAAPICDNHRAWAEEVATTMGFELATAPLPTPIEDKQQAYAKDLDLEEPC